MRMFCASDWLPNLVSLVINIYTCVLVKLCKVHKANRTNDILRYLRHELVYRI